MVCVGVMGRPFTLGLDLGNRQSSTAHAPRHQCLVAHRCTLCWRRTSRPSVRVRAKSADADDEAEQLSTPGRSELSATIRRKQQQVQAQIDELGMDALQDRLQSAADLPANPPYRLATLIQDVRLRTGRPVLVLEVAQPSPASTSRDVAELAAQAHYQKPLHLQWTTVPGSNGSGDTGAGSWELVSSPAWRVGDSLRVQYADWGADALAVLTDLEHTSTGYADLVAACRATRIPVLQRDWMLHPMQVVDAKEAGAAGVLGTIAQVSVRGAPVLSSFAAALGLDAPVEVVNKMEVEAMGAVGVPFFAMSIAVGLSLALPGFKSDMTKGMLGALPQGASSLVGITSLDEGIKAHAAGADALLLKRKMLVAAEDVQRLLEQLKYTTSGDY